MYEKVTNQERLLYFRLAELNILPKIENTVSTENRVH